MTRSDPVDKRQRDRALEHRASFIVQAPAGSGKTDLLTRRFLKLLAVVDEPEEILAITFTRAATAEMRARILQDLERAARSESTSDAARDALAREAVEHGQQRGWQLLEQPHRLNIETIDSLCLRIAQNQPLLSRLGGRLSPTEHATPLYSLAAQRTVGRLGSEDPALNAALQHLLDLRDNKLTDCVELIAGMLAKRDQWARVFPLSPKMTDDDWDQVRSALERPLRDEVTRVHERVYELISRVPLLRSELVDLAGYAAENGNERIAALAGMHEFPKPDRLTVEHWMAVADFLLTNEGNLRRKVDKNNGFRSVTAEQKKMKSRMEEFLARCGGIDGFSGALAGVRKAPLPRYDDQQWATLRHVFLVLAQAIAELRVLFAERNTVDFIEIGLAATSVLKDTTLSPDMLLAVSGNIRHLLVDEFQDTSRSHHDLLRLLIQAWEAEEDRTGFLVGDPMQSIYLFRQAEVELFEQVRRSGLVTENFALELESLQLKTNFRSHAGLTTRWNEIFQAVFGDGGAGGIQYEETVAAKESPGGEAVEVHAQIIGAGEGAITSEQRLRARDTEAAKVLEIIRQHQPHIEEAKVHGEEYRVAVLVRAKSHLARIMALLRTESIPFRAVELETLNERQELLDLMSLVRALLHPMDRVAWLSMLRAPWCGITMRDLHMLTGGDDKDLRSATILELIDARAHLLSEDGTARVRRVCEITQQALRARFQGAYAMSFSQWIEHTWQSLGGPECLDEAAQENARTFFELLDEVTPDGMRCLTANFDAEMDRLFAQPDPQVSERVGVQLMTIHKAKGLGFDVVIVPGLERASGRDYSALISWLERTDPKSGKTEMLVAPIGELRGDTHRTYDWVQRQRGQRYREELKRLLYVACTRARKSLHLIGTAELTGSGSLKPGAGDSLLRTAWPALKQRFEDELGTRQAKVRNFPSPVEANEPFEIAAAVEAPATTRLHRLPSNADLAPRGDNVPFVISQGGDAEVTFERPTGSRDARHIGSVVHALLDRVSRGAPIETLPAVARSLLRGFAYFGKALDDAAADVITAVQNCLRDPDGAWILAPHRQAQSENSLTDWKGGALETLRPDRVFVSGATPRVEGENHLWIIDYKMTSPEGGAGFFDRQREIYAPQLTRYERALRESLGTTLPVRFGLYYPRIAKLDWWGRD